MIHLRRRSMILAAGLAVLIVGSAGAEAATRSIDVVDNAFSPTPATAAEGDAVKWTNVGNDPHTTTSIIGGAMGWSHALSTGDSFSTTLEAAGTYAYYCEFHFGMDGQVKVPVIVSPSSGPVGTRFTVKVATDPAPTGFKYAPQVKIPGNSNWTSLPTTTARSVTYVANKTGKYFFRSKVKHGSLPGTMPSPAKSVTVG